ncbi:MAG: DsrE family protein [Gemmataceae bacterium]
MKMQQTRHILAVFVVVSFVFGLSAVPAAHAQTRKAQKIVVHLSHGLDNLHSVFMAVKVADGLQKKGASVTIFVDLEGVRIVDKRQPLNLRWGPGNNPLQNYYDSFVKRGGKILVCPHCAKATGLTSKMLRKGASIAAVGEFPDLVLQAAKIIDF